MSRQLAPITKFLGSDYFKRHQVSSLVSPAIYAYIPTS